MTKARWRERIFLAPSGKESIRFVVTGLAVAALFFVLSFSFVSWGVPAFGSHALAYLIAFFIGYIVQKNWTFQFRGDHNRAFPRYLALQSGCMIGSGIVAHALAVFEIPALYMSAITTSLAALVSYVISSRWVFSE